MSISRSRLSADVDSVTSRLVKATPTAGTVSAIVTNQAVVTPAAGTSLRLHRFHLHMDPAAEAGTFNTVTLKLGATVVFTDKFESGLPYLESLVVEGTADQALTITTSGAAPIFYNVRTEQF